MILWPRTIWDRFYSVYDDHPHDLPRRPSCCVRPRDAGYVPAMHSLGLLLVNHPELKPDPRKAGALLEAAANAGSWKSSIVLGILGARRARRPG